MRHGNSAILQPQSKVKSTRLKRGVGGILPSLSEAFYDYDAWPVRRHSRGYLPGRTASPSFGLYKIILLDERLALGCFRMRDLLV